MSQVLLVLLLYKCQKYYLNGYITSQLLLIIRAISYHNYYNLIITILLSDYFTAAYSVYDCLNCVLYIFIISNTSL